ncbi:MAG: helix-turn-helix domain-containing protein [Candidatus Phosphoribacter sp.]
MRIEELSEYLRVPVRTLYDWRRVVRGPCASHISRQLRCFVSDVHEWLASRRETGAGSLSPRERDRPWLGPGR